MSQQTTSTFNIVKAILIGLLASGLTYFGWASWQLSRAPQVASPEVVTVQAEPVVSTPTTASVTKPLPVTFKHLFSHQGVLDIDARIANPYILAGKETKTYIALQAQAREDASPDVAHIPSHLVLLIDRSGSMSGGRLDHAKAAASVLVQQLQEGDQIALITYDDYAQVVVSNTVINETTRSQVLTSIGSINLGGSTCISCGLDFAEQQMLALRAERQLAQRIILLSDGKPTAGVQSTDALVSMARKIEQNGTTISTIGVGLDYNEGLMAQLAISGNGNHYFVERPETLTAVLQDELNTLRQVAARQVIVTFELAANVRFIRAYDRDVKANGQRINVSLGDIPAKAIRTILLEVAVTPQTDLQPVTDLIITFLDAKSSQNQTITASLAMLTTTDRSLVDQHLEADVAARVAQAQINEDLERANEEIRKGNVVGARTIIQQRAKQSAEDNTVWQNKRLGSSIQILNEMESELAAPAAQTDSGRSRATKDNAAKMRGMSY